MACGARVVPPSKMLDFQRECINFTKKIHLEEIVMPIYEYRCNKCNCEFEILKLSLKDPEPRCPSCCSEEVQQLMSVGAVRPEGIATGRGGFNAPKCKPSGG